MCDSNSSTADFVDPSLHSGASGHSDSKGAGRLFDALRRGAVGAIDAAEKAAPRLGAAVEKGCETLAFGAVFAAVFPAAVAVQLVPEAIKTGGRRGLDAAHRFAERLTPRAGGRNPDRASAV